MDSRTHQHPERKRGQKGCPEHHLCRVPESAVLMTGEWPPPGTEPEWGLGGESQGGKDTSLGLGSSHPQGQSASLPHLCGSGAPGASLAAGGGRDEAKGHTQQGQLSLLRTHVPLHILRDERDLGLGISALTWKEGNPEGPASHTSSVMFGLGWRRWTQDGSQGGLLFSWTFISPLCQEEVGEEDRWL